MKVLTLSTMAVVCALTGDCRQEEPETAEAVASAGNPAVAVIEVHGPAKKRIGDLIHLDAHGSTADSISWHIDTSGVQIPNGFDDSQLKANAEQLRGLGYQVIGPTGDQTHYEVIERDLFLSSYPGTYRLVLAAAADTVDGVTIDTTGFNVVVGEGKGDPQPPPNPDPVPPPPPAEGFGLASSVPGWLATVPSKHRGNANEIGIVIGQQAMLAARGAFKTIAELQQSLGFQLLRVVKNKPAWRSFGTSLSAALEKLQAKGKIKTAEDYGRALAEVAEAM